MRWIPFTAIAVVATTAAAAGNSVRGSKHDLSVSGPGPVKAERETQVCVFCHVAHTGAAIDSPLSGRPDIGNTHVPYDSSTASNRGRAPTGASRICLSCHDGTIAVGKTIRRNIPMNAAAPGGRIPVDRRSNLGTDLRATHPVSVGERGAKGVHRPAPHSGARLDTNSLVQCTSCHDAHAEFGGSAEGKFLRAPTQHSELCASCHDISETSSHARSAQPFGPAEGNEAGYGSVGAAGCAACHRSHGGDVRGRLLSRSSTDEEDTLCLRCHSGSVARLDIGRELAKPFAHAPRPNGRHDASEGPENPLHRLPESSVSANRHVACVDCHDPHRVTRSTARAPQAGGVLDGVWGIDLAGNAVRPAQFEYEVCFKCHADSANSRRLATAVAAPRRAAEDLDLRHVFDPAAPSNHPVARPAQSPDVPSLMSPLGGGSFVYCTDCHSSDTSGGPRGPHGSRYPFLLERRYTTGDRAAESPDAYALCYKCHDRDVLLSTRSAFPLHRRHVVDGQAPCSVCHSAHGVSSQRGNAVNNAHLIDFDVSVVKPGQGPGAAYTSNGGRSGSCNLTCHAKRHDALAY